jgi:TRAP-type C4-dicarboxylate transport system permease small subunit
VIVVAFCWEVAARYAFNAPTEWASPLVSYLLPAIIFLMMPELTRRTAHISIDIFLANLPARASAMALRIIRGLAAGACLLAAWFSGEETFRQIEQGIWTSPPLALQKWTISIFVPYGMLNSGLHFMRQLLAAPMHVDSRGTVP